LWLEGWDMANHPSAKWLLPNRKRIKSNVTHPPKTSQINAVCSKAIWHFIFLEISMWLILPVLTQRTPSIWQWRTSTIWSSNKNWVSSESPMSSIFINRNKIQKEIISYLPSWKSSWIKYSFKQDLSFCILSKFDKYYEDE
jgi:hypothetical protein